MSRSGFPGHGRSGCRAARRAARLQLASVRMSSAAREALRIAGCGEYSAANAARISATVPEAAFQARDDNTAPRRKVVPDRQTPRLSQDQQERVRIHELDHYFHSTQSPAFNLPKHLITWSPLPLTHLPFPSPPTCRGDVSTGWGAPFSCERRFRGTGPSHRSKLWSAQSLDDPPDIVFVHQTPPSIFRS